jgi:putative ABC transport system substrate-binding protein
MRRRTFLTASLGSPLAYVLAARAQGQARPVVGFLNSASSATYSFNAAAFKEGLREAGYVEGQNVVIEYRWADNDYGRLPALAAELVSRKVSVIAATGDIASARRAGCDDGNTHHLHGRLGPGPVRPRHEPQPTDETPPV